jgi:hypothetical protein
MCGNLGHDSANALVVAQLTKNSAVQKDALLKKAGKTSKAGSKAPMLQDSPILTTS